RLLAAPSVSDTTHRPLPTDTIVSRPLLTRSDSDAIAKAVFKRLSQRKPAPAAAISQRELDSLRMAVEKSVTDSVLRMLAGARRGFRPDSARHGIVPVPGIPPEAAHPSMPGLGTPGVPLSVVVEDVADGSRDHTLGELARGLTDSLGKLLARRPATRIQAGDPVRAFITPGTSPQALGEALGADAVLTSLIQVRGDSIRLQVLLRDIKKGRNFRLMRRQVPRAE